MKLSLRTFASGVWSSVAVRVLAGVAGLVALAMIGGSALAGGGTPPPPPPADPPALTPAPASPLVPAVPPAPDPARWVDAQAPPPADPGAPPHGRASPDDPVILNAASLLDLRRLPGIGEKRAQSILALRARLGRFRQIEDLLKVKGIGRATLKKLRPLVRIDPAGPDRAPSDAG